MIPAAYCWEGTERMDLHTAATIWPPPNEPQP